MSSQRRHGPSLAVIGGLNGAPGHDARMRNPAATMRWAPRGSGKQRPGPAPRCAPARGRPNRGAPPPEGSPPLGGFLRLFGKNRSERLSQLGETCGSPSKRVLELIPPRPMPQVILVAGSGPFLLKPHPQHDETGTRPLRRSIPAHALPIECCSTPEGRGRRNHARVVRVRYRLGARPDREAADPRADGVEPGGRAGRGDGTAGANRSVPTTPGSRQPRGLDALACLFAAIGQIFLDLPHATRFSPLKWVCNVAIAGARS